MTSLDAIKITLLISPILALLAFMVWSVFMSAADRRHTKAFTRRVRLMGVYRKDGMRFIR